MRHLPLAAVLVTGLLGACSSSAGGRPPTDSRVQSLLGQVPPELDAGGAWLNVPPSSLAALRGRVVFLQFAFPT